MAVKIEAAQLPVRRCAEASDRGPRARAEFGMTKIIASDVAQRGAEEAVRILGAYCVSDRHPNRRADRHAKVSPIVEGANGFLRLRIARDLSSSIR